MKRLVAAALLLGCLPTMVAAAGQPNILVLMGDDWSWPHASAMGDPVVKTPTFDRLAREGVLFANAFVSAPSCTPSRLAIATGQSNWRLTDGANLGGSLARNVNVYPEMLQAAGYRIGFMGKGAEPSKHAYRSSDPFGPRLDSFEQFLSQRKPGEPFCFWFGSNDPHRPYEWQSGVKSGMKSAAVSLPACLPDNDTVRTDFCDYLWEVQRFDRQAGEMLACLETLGELDNTIVVMSGDNGMPFPRCKATLYDTGTHVPLAIRWGAQAKGGGIVKDFVSLTDLAPTFLVAAGLKPPVEMTGRALQPLLASHKAGLVDLTRTHVLTGREQHVYKCPCRALRTSDYLFILNFQPADWPTGEGKWPSRDRDFSFSLDPSPTKWFVIDHRQDERIAPFYKLAFGRRPDEELYDLKHDPQQLHNLAQQPSSRQIAQDLRMRLEAELYATQDPRFIPTGYQTLSIEGWTVFVSDALRAQDNAATEKALGLLRDQLKTVIERVPAQPLASLRTVPLWFSPAYPDESPRAAYHVDIRWVRDHGRNPAMAKGIEFTNIAIFAQEVRRMPVFVLHELAHAYHDQVLGFDHAEIKAAYQHAVESKSYDAILRSNGRTERAYAVKNEHEYFAETTEAFFGDNDFYPFNRAELEKHDPDMFRLLQRLWLAGEMPSPTKK